MSLRKGFTLIEIIVVMVIIGILATIAVPSYTNYVERGAAQAAQNNALIIYAADRNYYFSHNDHCRAGNLCGSTLSSMNADLPLNIIDNYYTYSCWYSLIAGVQPIVPPRFYCTIDRYYGANNSTTQTPWPRVTHPQITVDANSNPVVSCNDGGTGYCN